MIVHASLIVEYGVPFQPGSYISLNDSETMIGRAGGEWLPHISFTNAFISRKHAVIQYEAGAYMIEDLNSKHGTEINGEALIQGESRTLQNGDIISIAKGTVLLHFSYTNFDQTLDFGPILRQVSSPSLQMELDAVKQRVLYKGQEYTLSSKEYTCLELLLKHKNSFISKEKLKQYVWPERMMTLENIPDVSSEELNSLMYRLRRRLPADFHIESVRGKGYILQIYNEKA
ncbi:FHA domain-containing protein [Bacillus sp. 165]|uniref:FHA domain-containing protein n=1 Tax=Bacillus sp. 165 TaxID=1529117 RepID=UPI001ADCC118|nr:FHA domain-containing protein [Bacillus sp. 165]MBO9129979.1 winged helix-turn-helix domain-containing protein [Bacillus sp. 165]